MLARERIEAVCEGRETDPFAVLGPHFDGSGGLWLRVFLPTALQVTALTGEERVDLECRHKAGFFEGRLPGDRIADYVLRVEWQPGVIEELQDPYRFASTLGELDLWLLREGTHLRPHEVLGAHPCVIEGIAGVRFAVWAPQAERVSVVGDFNHWDSRRHSMRRLHEPGIFELFLPGIAPGARYKFDILGAGGRSWHQKADPYAFRSELRPATASIVASLPAPVAPPGTRQSQNGRQAPISIYEVHLGSWRRKAGGEPFLSWQELADTLIPYVQDLGFTHIELMPVTEHPLDASWGYQPTGMFAPTARFGDAEALQEFIARCHAAGLGVLLDWVPAHFPSDPHGLGRFDGSALYEHADPREGLHRDWNTLIYNYGRDEVRNFLIGSAFYWIERYGFDGLRVDAVASMLYRDYSRTDGDWLPNVHGGRENLEAKAFLCRLNEILGRELPAAVTIAEESTAWEGVSRPTSVGGLGFHYKWNMGWMNDTLRYISRDPIHRRHHQDELTFGLCYAFSENFVLPISHDEVVHGKGSLLGKMPGDRWQRFANVRAYLAFMFGHPGKKLLFMGCEFAQEREWDHDRELDWHLLAQAEHAGVQRLVRDLNHLYRALPALHRLDCEAAGFDWVDHADHGHSIISFMRRDPESGTEVLVVCNFTPTVHEHYRIGVPRAGRYEERLNTDSRFYGGSDVGSPFGVVVSENEPSHGRPCSVMLRLPPLATVFYEYRP
jgi:1,4-alpha-glucan branching enzyme